MAGDFIFKLRQYGADVDDAMERFLDDEELYKTCLDAFLTDPNFEQLDLAVKANDAQGAFAAGHALKGVAGNLSLKPIYDMLCDQVDELRGGSTDNLEGNYVALMAEVDRLKREVY